MEGFLELSVLFLMLLFKVGVAYVIKMISSPTNLLSETDTESRFERQDSQASSTSVFRIRNTFMAM